MTRQLTTFCCTLFCLLMYAKPLQAQQTCEAYQPNNVPDNRYIVHDNRTVSDKLTGLTWAQCTVGRSGENCATGSDSTFNWSDALNAAQTSTYAGFTDWRLPNLEEYRSLVNYSCRNPAINLTIFPNVQSRNNFYWTSEIWLRSGRNDISQLFDFLEGNQNANFRTGLAKVMLVRDTTTP